MLDNKLIVVFEYQNIYTDYSNIYDNSYGYEWPYSVTHSL